MSRSFKPLAFLLWLVAVSPSSGDVTLLTEDEIFEAWRESMLSSGFWPVDDILRCNSARMLFALADYDAEFCVHALLSPPQNRTVTVFNTVAYPIAYVPADVYAALDGSYASDGNLFVDGFQFVGPTPGGGLDPFHVLNEENGWHWYRDVLYYGVRYLFYTNSLTQSVDGYPLTRSTFTISFPVRTARLLVSVPPRPGQTDGGCWGDTGGIGWCDVDTYQAITHELPTFADDGGAVWNRPFVWEGDVGDVSRHVHKNFSSTVFGGGPFAGRAGFPSASNPLEDAAKSLSVFGDRMGRNPWVN